MHDALVSAIDPHKTVRSLASRLGFNDAEHAGELATVFDGVGRRIRYLRPNGVSLDAFGEILYDARVTNRRLAPDEVWTLLRDTFDSRPSAPPAPRRASARAQRSAIAKAQRSRSRKFSCGTCGQIARGTRNTLLLCGVCFEMSGAVVRMVRTDPLPEELMEQGGGS